MPKEPMRDVVVLLPGIMGSRLRKDGKTVWGFSGRALGRALLTRGRSVAEDLALPADGSAGGVVADALLPDLHLLPGFWKIDGYGAVAKAIHERFDVTEGANYFEFPYDWRRDLRGAGRDLERAAMGWLRAWRQSSGDADARLVLVAHSMGGLVSRYFLEVLGGWRETRALVTFGTPYRGSLKAVNTLANGMAVGPKRLDALSEAARTLTGIYQLLPTYRCYDPGDGTFRRLAEVEGIPHVDPARLADAMAFHQEIRDAVASNEADAGYGDPDRGYRLYPFVGIGQRTPQSARPDGAGVAVMEVGFDGVDRRGDGTVPRVSATPPEWDDPSRGTFTATKHDSIQNAEASHVGLEGILTGLTFDLGDFLRAGPTLAVEAGDLYFRDDPVVVRAEVEADESEPVVARLDGPDGALPPVPMVRVAEDRYEAAFGALPPGDYAATVSGGGADTPVTEAFTVADVALTDETDA